MGTGDALKTNVDSVREALGSDCTSDRLGALGKCSIKELSGANARTLLGDEYSDELDLPWMLIETAAGLGNAAQDVITVDVTEDQWVVRRVMKPVVAGVVIAERLLCTAVTQ